LSSRPPQRWPTQMDTGPACSEAAQTVSWGRQTKEAAFSCRRRAPSQKGRPRRRRACAALPRRGTGRAPAVLPEGERLRFAPGPPVQRRLKQCPGAALPKKRPSCAAGGRRQKRGAHADGVDARPCPAEGPAAIRPSSRRWPTKICTGATYPEAAKTVSWGRLTKEAALSRRRRAPSRKGRPRRRRGFAALPSRGAGRDTAVPPEGGRLMSLVRPALGVSEYHAMEIGGAFTSVSLFSEPGGGGGTRMWIEVRKTERNDRLARGRVGG